jgi:hypothetical protein
MDADEEDGKPRIPKPYVEDEENFNRRWTRMDADEEDRVRNPGFLSLLFQR